jgi:minor extracellular serine protease Vpr
MPSGSGWSIPARSTLLGENMKLLVQRVALCLMWAGSLSAGARLSSGRYAVILTDPAVGARYAASSVRAGAGKTYAAQVRAAQGNLRRELHARQIPVTGAVDTVLNAVFVTATAEQADELRSVAGVKAVAPLHTFHRRLDKAVQLENVPAAWNLLGGTGNAGAGMKIGIIDSGIDPGHPAFQDPSLPTPPGFPICDPYCNFATNKVIVARSYVNMLAAGSSPNPAVDSRPDDLSPRDHVGHGTALAMIAAGVRNGGPADTITGLAPKAWLGSYKVFGSPGVNDGTGGDTLITAIEDAVKDGMDVAVLSLGGPALSGPLDTGAACGLPVETPCDPEAMAVENAVKAGMLIVVSAGNDNGIGLNATTLNAIESPATAPSALAAGATTNSHIWLNSVRASGPNLPSSLQAIAALFGDGPAPEGPVTAPIKDVAAIDGTGGGCGPLGAGSLSGAFAIILRTPSQCSFATKVQNAQNAGAAGVILVQVAGSGSPIAPGGLTGTSIPTVMVGYSDGTALKSYVAANPSAQATLDPTLAPYNTSEFNTIAYFSSHGPSLTYMLKPEIVAVGTDLYMATQNYDSQSEMYDPTRYMVADGTSFSAPMGAGAAALVKQKTGLSGARLKSALVSTATQDITENGIPASVLAMGGGKLDAGSAVQASITADPATLSFGALPAGTSQPRSLPVSLHFAGTTATTFSLSVTTDMAQNTPALDRTSVNFAPGGPVQTVNLTLSGTPPSPGIYSGAISITGGAVKARVPYLYVVPDGVANDIVALVGDGFDGVVSQVIPGGFVAFKVVDQYGVAVSGLPVQWRVRSGSGLLRNADSATDQNGMAGAEAVLGPLRGTQIFSATAGGLTVTFTGNARLQPVIQTDGVRNAASFGTGAIVPGSYISLFGSGLADAFVVNQTQILPLSLYGVSVSFDAPATGQSVPGRILAVKPNQVNVQVPWELAGQTSVLIKVSIGANSGQLTTAQIAPYSPAAYTNGGNNAAALDENGVLVSAANPARRGHVVQLFLNGLGPMTNQPASGEPAGTGPYSRTTTDPMVTVGGKTASIQFSGMSPGNAGLDQINFVVPSDAPVGVQQLTVTIGNVTSPAVNLSVQ